MFLTMVAMIFGILLIMVVSKETKNKSVAELLILNKVYNEVGIKRKGEWIKVRNKQKAISIFNKHKNRKVTQKDRELNYANL